MAINEEISNIQDRILSAVEVEKLYLFGSYVNGTQNENSDYDFYMVIPNDGIRPIDAMGNAHSALRGFKGKSVDILAGTTEVFNRRVQGVTLERKIAREGLLLYER